MKQRRVHLYSLLGVSYMRTLKRPQRVQRRLLRLGQSPDPGDIESLVGSVTPQCPQLLTAREVPQGDAPFAVFGQGIAPAEGEHLLSIGDQVPYDTLVR